MTTYKKLLFLVAAFNLLASVRSESSPKDSGTTVSLTIPDIVMKDMTQGDLVKYSILLSV